MTAPAAGWLAVEYAVANVGEGSLADFAGNGGDISAFRARIVRV